MSAVLLQDVKRRLSSASRDELRVVDVVVRRLERRREKHGPLDLSRRPNTFNELDEGLIDAVIACAVETLRAEDQRHEEARRGMLLASAAEEERRELARWENDDRHTRVSGESVRIAMRDIDDREPYEGWDMSDVGGEGG